MKTILTTYFLFFAIAAISQSWQPVTLQMQNGSVLKGQAKFREGISFQELRFRNEDRKRWIPLDSIVTLQTVSRNYEVLGVPALEGRSLMLAQVLPNGLYHGVFRERQCLCNQSYRMVEAYVVKFNGRLILLRKKAFRDRFSEPSILRNFFNEVGEEWSFADFPSRWAERMNEPSN